MNVSKKDEPKSEASARRAAAAFVALARAYEELAWGVTELLKDHSVSMQQYNVLRILRGAHPQRLPCQEIGSRMINRDPDVTRLIDRLEKAEFVDRERSAEDRRVILVGITRRGITLLDRVDAPILALHERQFAGLKATDVRGLTVGLEALVGRGT